MLGNASSALLRVSRPLDSLSWALVTCTPHPRSAHFYTQSKTPTRASTSSPHNWTNAETRPSVARISSHGAVRQYDRDRRPGDASKTKEITPNLAPPSHRSRSVFMKNEIKGRLAVKTPRTKKHAVVQRGAAAASKRPPGNSTSKILLRPHVLSERLKRICGEGNLPKAVAALKEAPLDAQNSVVWNTMIWECMKAAKYQLAFELFTDMKRRGFSPTSRTYQTMFQGLSQIENWKAYPKQLAHAHSLYEYFRRHIESVKSDDPQSPEVTARPLNGYIKLLGDAGEYQKIFDVYYSLDQKGAFAPDQFFFTAILKAVAQRKATSSNARVGKQIASEAKLLWQHMLKASQRSKGLDLDTYAISAMLMALSKGEANDHSFALNIVREHLGLTALGEPAEPTSLLTRHTLAATLSLCLAMQDYPLCIHFGEQVMRHRPAPREESILDRQHMEHILRAYVHLARAHSLRESEEALKLLHRMLRDELSGYNGPKIRPSMDTFNLALTTCWRCKDWRSALKTFELMTGYCTEDFRDEAGPERWRNPRVQNRTKGRNLVPDAQAMSSIIRTSLASDSPPHIRQALRMVDHIGIYNMFGEPPVGGRANLARSRKEERYTTFYKLKLANALKEAVDRALVHGAGLQLQQWLALKEAAEEMSRRPTSRSEPEVPELEQLGP